MLMFYTVRIQQRGYPVNFIDPKTLKREKFVGPFGDPGEASQEFKACIGGDTSCYLDERTFNRKLQALRELRKTKQEKDMVRVHPCEGSSLPLFDGEIVAWESENWGTAEIVLPDGSTQHVEIFRSYDGDGFLCMTEADTIRMEKLTGHSK